MDLSEAERTGRNDKERIRPFRAGTSCLEEALTAGRNLLNQETVDKEVA